MNRLIMILLFTCVCATAQAQVNFVKNPGFESYSKCPDDYEQITYAQYWSNAIDTIFHVGSYWQSEYYNSCANPNLYTGLPNNMIFYQNAHEGSGMVGASFYFDKTPPSTVFPDYREYLQGRLLNSLVSGKKYCISFYVNMMEISGYAQNGIGAYLDNGAINALPVSKGSEITSVIPDIVSLAIINDTANWIKVEGSFIADGNETHITIGNFLKNDDVDVITTSAIQYSYYLIDDVSVIPVDLEADAGPNRWVEFGKQVKIGRVGDTTALGLDCKWYHNGSLIDSGAVIEVKAKSISGLIDTYVVVQTICGLVKTDTVTVTTVPLGIKEWGQENVFSVYPNPSDGVITITAKGSEKGATLKVYDLLGRTNETHSLEFTNQRADIRLHAPAGTYILEMTTQPGTIYRQRINLK